MNNDMPIIDIPEALTRSMGDVDFLKMMLEEFHRSIPEYATRIRCALEAKDMKTLNSDAHQFKGAAANLGAKAMAHEALKLEQIGKTGTVDDNANQAVSQLENAMAAFSQYFENIDWKNVSTKTTA
jgi:HPt (histidine-containing phosphotransfer) domain-containing protein